MAGRGKEGGRAGQGSKIRRIRGGGRGGGRSIISHFTLKNSGFDPGLPVTATALIKGCLLLLLP